MTGNTTWWHCRITAEWRGTQEMSLNSLGAERKLSSPFLTLSEKAPNSPCHSSHATVFLFTVMATGPLQKFPGTVGPSRGSKSLKWKGSESQGHCVLTLLFKKLCSSGQGSPLGYLARPFPAPNPPPLESGMVTWPALTNKWKQMWKAGLLSGRFKTHH